MASTSDFKNGLCIVFNKELYVIVEFQHVKPGKGAAFVRTKLKNIMTGKVIENTFNAGVKIDTARIERASYQFLYKDNDKYYFMHNDSFEQVGLDKDLINASQFLKEGQNVEISFHQETEKPLSCELPPFVELKVVYTEPGIRGDTANKATKPATLETGAKIQVPLFINNEEILKVDTRTETYAERAKK
jgi:elongation factor P